MNIVKNVVVKLLFIKDKITSTVIFNLPSFQDYESYKMLFDRQSCVLF